MLELSHPDLFASMQWRPGHLKSRVPGISSIHNQHVVQRSVRHQNAVAIVDIVGCIIGGLGRYVDIVGCIISGLGRYAHNSCQIDVEVGKDSASISLRQLFDALQEVVETSTTPPEKPK